MIKRRNKEMMIRGMYVLKRCEKGVDEESCGEYLKVLAIIRIFLQINGRSGLAGLLFLLCLLPVGNTWG